MLHEATELCSPMMNIYSEAEFFHSAKTKFGKSSNIQLFFKVL